MKSMPPEKEIIVTVFGSGNILPGDETYLQAEETGKLLAQNQYIVCTGGYGGIMEAVSKGVKSAHGKTIGITVETVSAKPNMYVDENVVMPNWIERLMELIAIGDIYVVFRGGSGTLVELSEALEVMNRKIMKEKRIILYGSFWEKVVETLRQDSKNLDSLIRRTIRFAHNPKDILSALKNL